MKTAKGIRIAAMVIIGLYTILMVLPFNGGTWGPYSPIFTPFTLLAGVGAIFLAWKRPLAGGLVALILALLLFFVGARQSIAIYGENAGIFPVIMFVVTIPLLLAGVLLLAAHRASRLDKKK